MKTIEIKLAGILFKVWYDKESYEVHDVKRFDTEGWQEVPQRMREHIEYYLSPVVIIAAGGADNGTAVKINLPSYDETTVSFKL